jgi:hypothetical protein
MTHGTMNVKEKLYFIDLNSIFYLARLIIKKQYCVLKHVLRCQVSSSGWKLGMLIGAFGGLPPSVRTNSGILAQSSPYLRPSTSVNSMLQSSSSQDT